MGAAQAAEFYQGTAYAPEGNAAIYLEHHYVFGKDGAPEQLVVYRCPDGKAFARKQLHNSPASVAPDFDFVDGRSGYREGARAEGDGIRVYTQKNSSAPENAKVVVAKPEVVIDAGFDRYVKTHWDALLAATARFAFLLPSRLDYVEIRLGGVSQSVEDGQALQHLRMRMDAWYGFLAAPIELTYTVADHRLRRFAGVGVIRSRDGANLSVRIEFPDAPNEIAQSAVDAALQEPLDGQCAG